MASTLFPERGRYANGKLKKRFDFTDQMLEYVFNPNADIEPIDTFNVPFAKEFPPFTFSAYQREFTPGNRFALEIDDETFSSVEDYYRKMMFRELTGYDPPQSMEDHMSMIERGVTTQDWERWTLSSGLMHMQRAILHRVGSDKTLRSLLVNTHRRLIIYTHRCETFFSAGCCTESVGKWFRHMCAMHLHVSLPRNYPVHYKQLHSCTKVANVGWNVLGVMFMALRETLREVRIDEIVVPLPGCRAIDRPITHTTRYAGRKRLLDSRYDSATNLNGARRTFFPADDSENAGPNRKRLHFDEAMFGDVPRFSGAATPCSMFADMGIDHQLRRSRSNSSASSSATLEPSARMQMDPNGGQSRAANNDEVADLDDEVEFLGVQQGDHILAEQIEQKPNILELPANQEQHRDPLVQQLLVDNSVQCHSERIQRIKVEVGLAQAANLFIPPPTNQPRPNPARNLNQPTSTGRRSCIWLFPDQLETERRIQGSTANAPAQQGPDKTVNNGPKFTVVDDILSTEFPTGISRDSSGYGSCGSLTATSTAAGADGDGVEVKQEPVTRKEPGMLSQLTTSTATTSRQGFNIKPYHVIPLRDPRLVKKRGVNSTMSTSSHTAENFLTVDEVDNQVQNRNDPAENVNQRSERLTRYLTDLTGTEPDNSSAPSNVRRGFQSRESRNTVKKWQCLMSMAGMQKLFCMRTEEEAPNQQKIYALSKDDEPYFFSGTTHCFTPTNKAPDGVWDTDNLVYDSIETYVKAMMCKELLHQQFHETAFANQNFKGYLRKRGVIEREVDQWMTTRGILYYQNDRTMLQSLQHTRNRVIAYTFTNDPFLGTGADHIAVKRLCADVAYNRHVFRYPATYPIEASDVWIVPILVHGRNLLGAFLMSVRSKIQSGTPLSELVFDLPDYVEYSEVNMVKAPVRRVLAASNRWDDFVEQPPPKRSFRSHQRTTSDLGSTTSVDSSITLGNSKKSNTTITERGVRERGRGQTFNQPSQEASERSCRDEYPSQQPQLARLLSTPNLEHLDIFSMHTNSPPQSVNGDFERETEAMLHHHNHMNHVKQAQSMNRCSANQGTDLFKRPNPFRLQPFPNKSNMTMRSPQTSSAFLQYRNNSFANMYNSTLSLNSSSAVLTDEVHGAGRAEADVRQKRSILASVSPSEAHVFGDGKTQTGPEDHQTSVVSFALDDDDITHTGLEVECAAEGRPPRTAEPAQVEAERMAEDISESMLGDQEQTNELQSVRGSGRKQTSSVVPSLPAQRQPVSDVYRRPTHSTASTTTRLELPRLLVEQRRLSSHVQSPTISQLRPPTASSASSPPNQKQNKLQPAYASSDDLSSLFSDTPTTEVDAFRPILMPKNNKTNQWVVEVDSDPQETLKEMREKGWMAREEKAEQRASATASGQARVPSGLVDHVDASSAVPHSEKPVGTVERTNEQQEQPSQSPKAEARYFQDLSATEKQHLWDALLDDDLLNAPETASMLAISESAASLDEDALLGSDSAADVVIDENMAEQLLQS